MRTEQTMLARWPAAPRAEYLELVPIEGARIGARALEARPTVAPRGPVARLLARVRVWRLARQ